MTEPSPSTEPPQRIALTPTEAAAAIGVSRRMLFRLLRTDAALRRCRRYLTPRCPRFDVDRLKAWLASRPDTAHPRGTAPPKGGAAPGEPGARG